MTLRLADHCGRFLSDLAEEDPRLWVLDGDLADSDGAVHFARRHPGRFVMAGISEQAMISVAAGMASCGLRPWVFSFASFLCYRGCDQIRVSVSQARQPVTLVGSHSGGCSSRNGKSHAALNDIAITASLPGMRIWSPAGPGEVRHACRAVLGEEAPAYLRLPRRPLDDPPGEPAAWRWIGDPLPVALVATGLGTHLALDARRRLADRGLEVGVLHCLRLSPLPEGLVETLTRVKIAFVVEDHSSFGGLASLLQHHLAGRPAAGRLLSLAWPSDWDGQSGGDDELLRLHGLDPERIAARVEGRLRGGLAGNGAPDCQPAPGTEARR